MAEKHPYVTAPGGLEKTINHFRKKRLPPVIDSGFLKKLGFAPNNESYVLNVLRFLKLIDTRNETTDLAVAVFSNHEDAAFFEAFSPVVRDAYSGLFDLHGDDAWNTGRESLIGFFRKSDRTSATVGGRQASTFLMLAQLSGHGESSGAKPRKSNEKARAVAGASKKKTGTVAHATQQPAEPSISLADKVGLTVRIEINLPAVDDQDTYDKIFKSIRENLLNG